MATLIQLSRAKIARRSSGLFAGGEISAALLNWAIARAKQLGRRYLRLDCEASRARLRALYEKAGFRHHSDRQVGPYFVSRYEFPL